MDAKYAIFQIKTNKTAFFKTFLKTHHRCKNSKCARIILKRNCTFSNHLKNVKQAQTTIFSKLKQIKQGYLKPF